MVQRTVSAALVALMVPLAAGLQEDDPTMQQQEGSILPHKLKRTIIQSLTEESGVDELGHPVCDVSCNGEKVHVDGYMGAEERGSCWGNFNFKCNIKTDDYVGTASYKCDGAFTFVPVNNSDGVHVHALLCDGAMFELVEVTRTEAPAPSLLQTDPPTWCPPGIKCATGLLCLANSQIVTADSDGYTESYVHCEDVLGTGYGYKKDDGNTQQGRKDHMHDEELTAAEMFEQALMDGSSWGGWARPGSGLHDAGVAPQDMQASSVEQLQGDSSKDSHKWTCNKKKIHPWLSWWPCWGKTEFSTKSESGDGESSLDIACHGFSIPMRMSCKGLSTIHTSQESEEGSMEAMVVTKGHKRFKIPHRKMHGWTVSMTFSRGFSTIHSRAAAPDTEASEEVRGAMDAATRAAIREEV